MLLECISNKNAENELTVGKIYIGIYRREIEMDWYSIWRTDKGTADVLFLKERFVEVPYSEIQVESISGG